MIGKGETRANIKVCARERASVPVLARDDKGDPSPQTTGLVSLDSRFGLPSCPGFRRPCRKAFATSRPSCQLTFRSFLSPSPSVSLQGKAFFSTPSCLGVPRSLGREGDVFPRRVASRRVPPRGTESSAVVKTKEEASPAPRPLPIDLPPFTLSLTTRVFSQAESSFSVLFVSVFQEKEIIDFFGRGRRGEAGGGLEGVENVDPHPAGSPERVDPIGPRTSRPRFREPSSFPSPHFVSGSERGGRRGGARPTQCHKHLALCRRQGQSTEAISGPKKRKNVKQNLVLHHIGSQALATQQICCRFGGLWAHPPRSQSKKAGRKQSSAT